MAVDCTFSATAVTIWLYVTDNEPFRRGRIIQPSETRMLSFPRESPAKTNENRGEAKRIFSQRGTSFRDGKNLLKSLRRYCSFNFGILSFTRQFVNLFETEIHRGETTVFATRGYLPLFSRRTLSLSRLIPKRASFFAVSDASGRYSSQFHFGNGFWLGSSTLCKELNATGASIRQELDDTPPYALKFHVARMYLTLPKELEFSVSTPASFFPIVSTFPSLTLVFIR